MRVFAADIGGTYSRFGLFEAGHSAASLRCLAVVRLASAAPDFAFLLEQTARAGLGPEHADAAVLAVAGPARDADRIRLSNLPFAVDAAAVRQRAPGVRTALINDFEAQAMACLTPLMAGAQPLALGAKTEERGQGFRFPRSGSTSPCALIGAGTGLGMAVLVPDASERAGARVVPSEGGHAAFAFMDAEERAFGDFAAARKGLPYARGDDVVTGPGLALLHEFLTGRALDPAGITAEPHFAVSATCGLFARFYGRACRHLALHCLPSDLVIAGGLAARCPDLLRHPAFGEEFANAPGEHRVLLEGVRLWHNADPDGGLWGAALAGLDLLR